MQLLSSWLWCLHININGKQQPTADVVDLSVDMEAAAEEAPEEASSSAAGPHLGAG